MSSHTKSGEITFIVDTLLSIGFPYKGGSIATHKLAYEIANEGYPVYVFNEPLYPHENIVVIKTKKESHNDDWWGTYTWENFSYNPDRTVTIYSNLTWGNPFNTKYNARWFLSDADMDKWESQKDDVIYNYGTFNIPTNIQEKLTVFDYKIHDFYNTNNPNRSGFGFLKHKFTPDWGMDFVDKLNAKTIPTFNGKQNVNYLLEEFNKYEYIIMFDTKSYYSVIAALCGAKVIIVNDNDNITPTEYRIQNPIQMCGVSYGFNDLKWANNTIGLVRENLLNLEKKDKETILKFIEFWRKKIL
jgi:hypothetical protein